MTGAERGRVVALRPFEGHVVAAEHAARVVAPPYDLLTAEQRVQLAAERPDSFLNVLPAGPADVVALRANRAALDRLMKAERFVAIDGPALAVLRLDHPGGSTIAVIGDVEMGAYVDGRVLPHEHVRADRVGHLARHLEVVRIASSPVCVVHRPSADVDALTDEILRTTSPEVNILADDRVRLSLHLVTTPSLQEQLAAAVDTAGRLYVADGHHRAAAVGHASHAGPGPARVLTAAVPADQLRVLAFHRRVDGLGDASASSVLAEFEALDLLPEPLTAASAPEVPGIVHVSVEGRWWAIDLRDRRVEGPVEGLDVRLLERELLEPLGALGADPDHGGGIEVVAVPAPMGLDALVRPGSVGLALHAPRIEDVMAVADAGAVMPAKSTYLAPKLRSGLIVVPR
jgi:uncharacterized protein (DUF1015 family)